MVEISPGFKQRSRPSGYLSMVMRALAVIGSFIAGMLVQAQNWALINPAYKYNYSNDGTDTISNQIFVTQIDTLGVDSFRYHMNRIGVVCPNCSSGFTSYCYNGGLANTVKSNVAQFLGGSLLRSGIDWLLEGDDTLRFPSNAPLGATWTGPGGISGSVLALDTATILGSADSVKCVGYSNGDTLVIAKGHGVGLHRPSMGDGHLLIGRNGPLGEGAQYPNALDLFDYHPGDILQYTFANNYTDGYHLFFTTGIEKYRVLTRTDLMETTSYNVHVISVSETECYDPYNWWMPCGISLQEDVGQTDLVVQHDSLGSGNFFTARWRTQLFPGCVGQGDYPPSGRRVLLQARLDSVQRYVIEQWTDFEPYSLLCPTDQDSSIHLPDQNTGFVCIYTEGIGLISEGHQYFESSDGRTLMAYSINGVVFGSITPDDVLLRIDPVDFTRRGMPYPNPASDQLFIPAAAPGASVRILDAVGRMVALRTISSGTEPVDLSDIRPGMYFLDISGLTPYRFIIAR